MSDEKQMIVKLAFVYTQNGEWYKAIEEYRKILALEPQNASMYNSIGDCYARKGDDQDALDSYWKARELYQEQMNAAKAQGVEKKIAKLNPDLLDPRHKSQWRALQKSSEADALAQEGKLEEALEQYRAMIAAEPSNFAYREKLAALFLENAQVSEAADEFRSVALFHVESGHLDAARTYAAKAAELDADSPGQLRLECTLAEAAGETERVGELQEKIGRGELASGRFDLALEPLEKARAAGRSGLEEPLARTYLGLKRYDEARAAFQRLSAARPDDEGVLECLLTLDEQAKDWPQALAHVNQLLGLHPEHAGFLMRGARILTQSGKNAEAAQLYLRLAGLAFKDGHYDTVLGHFETILAIQPENLEVIKKRAELLFKLGRKAETIAAYKDLEKHLQKRNPEEARKVAVLVNRIQNLPDQITRGTLH